MTTIGLCIDVPKPFLIIVYILSVSTAGFTNFVKQPHKNCGNAFEASE